MLQLTRHQLQEIDRRSTADYHIPGIVLMENAARAVAHEACQILANECVGEVLILCGGGNNGGDGLAAARHLHNRGADVTIGLLADPGKYRGDALINWKIAEAMKIPAAAFDAEMLNNPRPLLVIDAIFGTGLSKPPRDPFGAVAAAVNKLRLPVLAVDLPSGLDCDTGNVLGSCIRAERTLTFVAQKTGFARAQVRQYLGQVIVGDIGCPTELIEAIAQGT